VGRGYSFFTLLPTDSHGQIIKRKNGETAHEDNDIFSQNRVSRPTSTTRSRKWRLATGTDCVM